MPEFDRSTPVTVAVRAQSGTVDIHAEERTTVVAEVVPLDGTDASRHAAQNTVIALDGDTLVVSAPESSGWSWRRPPKLGVTVRVPLDSSITARTASADLRATGRYAQAQVILASGDAEVDEVTGDVQMEAASGDITVHSAGGAVKAGTASGDVQIGVLRQGDVQIRSASGDVKVGVAAGTGVWLDVTTASGSTTNELTMGLAAPVTATAALRLHIRTASGDIEIRRVTASARAA